MGGILDRALTVVTHETDAASTIHATNKAHISHMVLVRNNDELSIMSPDAKLTAAAVVALSLVFMVGNFLSLGFFLVLCLSLLLFGSRLPAAAAAKEAHAQRRHRAEGRERPIGF
jgi:hypothetical protein